MPQVPRRNRPTDLSNEGLCGAWRTAAAVTCRTCGNKSALERARRDKRARAAFLSLRTAHVIAACHMTALEISYLAWNEEILGLLPACQRALERRPDQRRGDGPRTGGPATARRAQRQRPPCSILTSSSPRSRRTARSRGTARRQRRRHDRPGRPPADARLFDPGPELRHATNRTKAAPAPQEPEEANRPTAEAWMEGLRLAWSSCPHPGRQRRHRPGAPDRRCSPSLRRSRSRSRPIVTVTVFGEWSARSFQILLHRSSGQERRADPGRSAGAAAPLT